MDKDPDVRVEAIFVVGQQMADKVAKNKKNSMPYNWQQHYWFASMYCMLSKSFSSVLFYQTKFSRSGF